MSEGARLSPVSVILCDDVRTEQNGKHIVIGAFAEGINVPHFPATIAVAQFLVFTTVGQGHASFELQLRWPGSEPPLPTIQMEAEVSAPTKPNRLQTAAIPPMAIVVEEPGEISVYCRNKGDEWQLLRIVDITLPPTASTNAP